MNGYPGPVSKVPLSTRKLTMDIAVGRLILVQRESPRRIRRVRIFPYASLTVVVEYLL
jgi:hypothetical protein